MSHRLNLAIASVAVIALVSHLVLRYAVVGIEPWGSLPADSFPLILALALGGTPLVFGLLRQAFRGEFGSDLLAGISIVTSVALGEHLAGVLVVLMLSGGQALEAYAVGSASSVLQALARRMPTHTHRRGPHGLIDVPVTEVRVGDEIVVLPHETCPVDGTVVEGHGSMDESYLTGEPYRLSKAPGAAVLSGAINGEAALTLRAERVAIDSRYAQIMQVMRESEQRRPRLRRLGDRLGAAYTPLAVGLALLAWGISGDVTRFLAVLVVATPCPLLIAIPVAIIGSVSLAARRGIIVRDPVALERLGSCRTAMFDKTGTLTYGEPRLTAIDAAPGWNPGEAMSLAASLERYSRHPLARAILDAAQAQGIPLAEASEVAERPGRGLTGRVAGRAVAITGRAKLAATSPALAAGLPAIEGGLECVLLVDDSLAATLRFRDEPRPEGSAFIRHLAARHGYGRVMLVSGDRESEVLHVARSVGITEVYAGQTPEQKLALVRREVAHNPTVFMGDGINDAPALAAATVGIAFGAASDVTSQAAGAIILDSSLQRVDELMHIGARMRTIALQSALGGMALSLIGMVLASAGLLSPVAGALAQELIDVAAVVNALRAARPPRVLTDY